MAKNKKSRVGLEKYLEYKHFYMKLKSLNTNYWSVSSPMRNIAEVDMYQHKHFRPRPFE